LPAIIDLGVEIHIADPSPQSNDTAFGDVHFRTPSGPPENA
jgi:hypothetical protein